MMEARKSPLFEKGFALYLFPLIRFSFSHLFGQNVQKTASQPVIFIANHSSWWDGLLFFFLNRVFWRHDIHMMMLEKNLKSYPYFRLLGAFSINRKKPKEVIASLQYAESLLKAGKSVVIFPQGDEFHLETRPLRFESGIAFLLEKCPEVPVVPISLYYSFRHERKPEVWILQGPAFGSADIKGDSRKEKTAFLQQYSISQLDRLKQLVIAEKTEEFQDLLKRRES